MIHAGPTTAALTVLPRGLSSPQGAPCSRLLQSLASHSSRCCPPPSRPCLCSRPSSDLLGHRPGPSASPKAPHPSSRRARSRVTPACPPNRKLKHSQNKSLWSSYTDFQAIHPQSWTAINGTITQWGAQGKTLEPSFSSTIFLPSNNSTPINTDSLLEDKESLHQLSSAAQPRSFSDPESYCWSWNEQALFSLKKGFCVCCPSVWKMMPPNLP